MNQTYRGYKLERAKAVNVGYAPSYYSKAKGYIVHPSRQETLWFFTAPDGYTRTASTLQEAKDRIDAILS